MEALQNLAGFIVSAESETACALRCILTALALWAGLLAILRLVHRDSERP